MNYETNPRTLLSTIWIFVLFNMILRDLHEFPTDGYIEEMMALKLSDTTMLFYAFIVELPILMVLLTRLLSRNANKWATTVAAVMTTLGMLSTLPAGDLDDLFFALVNTVALVFAVRIAWQFSEGLNKKALLL